MQSRAAGLSPTIVCNTCLDVGYNVVNGRAERCTCANGDVLPQNLLDHMNAPKTNPAKVLPIRRGISPAEYTDDDEDNSTPKQVKAMQPITQADIAAVLRAKGRA